MSVSVFTPRNAAALLVAFSAAACSADRRGSVSELDQLKTPDGKVLYLSTATQTDATLGTKDKVNLDPEALKAAGIIVIPVTGMQQKTTELRAGIDASVEVVGTAAGVATGVAAVKQAFTPLTSSGSNTNVTVQNQTAAASDATAAANASTAVTAVQKAISTGPMRVQQEQGRGLYAPSPMLMQPAW